MFECHVCGNKTAHHEFVSEVFLVDARRVLVEHIDAEVCDHCGEAVFSSETTDEVRRVVHGANRPVRTVALDVFALA